jgi:hypothetical protein
MMKLISFGGATGLPIFTLCSFLLLPGNQMNAADWPMWRADAGRTATVPPALPEKLQVLWTRDLAPLTPAYRDVRLQFDRGYEPVVLGKQLFLASSRDDSVTAYDTDTGAEIWKVYADGPVRFAPVAGDGRVIFGADDGMLRCVAAATGKLLWQMRAVPADRQLLGNGRLISVWPIRGGPVLRDGRVYFAAGVWPLEGIFIYCIDAATGKVIWLNDRTGYIYGVHPHNAEAFGGVTPQGYLLIEGTDLVVPNSSAYPARFDLATGALKEFALPKMSRYPGGWFVSIPDTKEAQKLAQRGLLFDIAVNTNRHEDKPHQVGLTGVRRSFRAGDREWSFDQPLQGVTGKVHSMIAADGKCFTTTEEGHLYALTAPDQVKGAVKHWPLKPSVTNPKEETAGKFLAAVGTERGYAVVVGLSEPTFLASLANQSQFKILALATEGENLPAARQSLASARFYGERVALRQVAPCAAGLPPYFASLIVLAPGKALPDAGALKVMYSWLRPFGGKLVGPSALLKFAESLKLPQAKLTQHGNGLAIISREGALEGSVNYQADWMTSEDLLVKAPVGVLWFDDTLGHFKRAPQPKFIDGVMISSDKDWLDASTRKGLVDYRLLPTVFSDVYTGRIFATNEVSAMRQQFSQVDLQKIQPSQYRPPTQKDAWKPEAPKAGTRVNPLTGETEPRKFPKSYGCDGGYDYGLLYTMRSGTAAFYDKRLDSGTIHISGPRSGCTSSIIPANGLLNVPYFYEGCSCSYPLPTALALVNMPPTFEQWAAWGIVPTNLLMGRIERLGLNFGAPGDRRTEDGTLWLGYPSVGGPSPKISVSTEPAAPKFYYHHSLWIQGGEGWPWVGASGCQGLRTVTLSGLKKGNYTVRLVFAEPDKAMLPKGRQFDVQVQNNLVLENYNVVSDAGGSMRVVTKTIPKIVVIDGTLTVSLKARQGETLLSGLEIIREGLSIGSVPFLARVSGW